VHFEYVIKNERHHQSGLFGKKNISLYNSNRRLSKEEKMNPRVKLAREYAISKHGDQMYGDQPYRHHLDQVYAIIAQLNLGEDYEIAAYLHDVKEDANISEEELIENFGERVAKLVLAVSGEGANRHERHEDTKRKLQEYPDAIILKMADRLANMRSSKVNKPSLFKTYCKEHVSFTSLFSSSHPVLWQWLQDELPSATLNQQSQIHVTAKPKMH
jgi:guanosine-3',5'-bis(diphosphate) 3'-pyrophosphohydrolase